VEDGGEAEPFEVAGAVWPCEVAPEAAPELVAGRLPRARARAAPPTPTRTATVTTIATRAGRDRPGRRAAGLRGGSAGGMTDRRAAGAKGAFAGGAGGRQVWARSVWVGLAATADGCATVLVSWLSSSGAVGRACGSLARAAVTCGRSVAGTAAMSGVACRIRYKMTSDVPEPNGG